MDFGEIKMVNLREIWPNESINFTPWLAKNLNKLGEALGMELELEKQEADVGDFSLDILAKDLGTGRKVIIENQLTETNHDHLGKLLTYAGGFDAGVIIWIVNSIRDEHRQAIEWLNQKTDTDVDFFCVVIEILRIDNSKPAFNFKPVVFPNEWQKSKRNRQSDIESPRGEAYRQYFQKLIDVLREKHKFTGARIGQPQNWYSFSSGISGITYSTSFAQGSRVRAEIYIDFGNKNENKQLFDNLFNQKSNIEKEFGEPLEWERLDEKRASRIAIYRNGSIDSDEATLDEIRNWSIQQLLNLKKVFLNKIKI